MKYDISHLTDTELSVEVERLARAERAATLALVVHLAEFDARKLHLAAAFPSLYRYCRAVLTLSEHEAYHRIVAARTVRRFPIALDPLGAGRLNLTTLRLLAPHLTAENHSDLLAAASGRTRRQVQRLLATRFPKPDVPISIRPVAGSAPAAVAVIPIIGGSEPSPAADGPFAVSAQGIEPSAQAPVRPERPIAPPPPSAPEPTRPLSATRYEFHFTGRCETYEKLERAKDLLRHAVPDGDVAEIFDRALSALLRDVEKRRFALTDRPRVDLTEPPAVDGTLRYIAAPVRRAVWLRRCVLDG